MIRENKSLEGRSVELINHGSLTPSYERNLAFEILINLQSFEADLEHI